MSSRARTADKHVAAPIHTTSSTSVANPATPSLNTQRSATDDTLNLITQQRDHGQGGQAVSSGVLLLAETIVISDRTVINTQEQTTCTNDTTDQYLVDLRNTTNLVVNTASLLSDTIDSLRTLNEELKQDKVAILQEEAETLEDTKAKHELFGQLINSNWTPEIEDAATATALGIVDLAKKRHILGQKRQEHQAKRLKYDADIKEFSIKEFMATRGLVLE